MNECDVFCICCGDYCGEGEWLCVNCKERNKRKNNNFHIAKTKGKKRYDKRKNFNNYGGKNEY